MLLPALASGQHLSQERRSYRVPRNASLLVLVRDEVYLLACHSGRHQVDDGVDHSVKSIDWMILV